MKQMKTGVATALILITQTMYAMADAGPVQTHSYIKEKIIEGGLVWMTPIMLCLLVGLAIAIERIIALNLADDDTPKLLNDIDKLLAENKEQEAVELCRGYKGPASGIVLQGLLRIEEGPENMEKSMLSYGSVETARLEKGLPWLALLISLAPMLGFLGTVVGMVEAFDSIAKAGEISAALVAGGIKIALITTVGGLITAIILQVLYSYLQTKIDSILAAAEEAAVLFVDIVIRNTK